MEKLCPMMKGPCIEHQCRWYVSILGQNPQSGAMIDKWGCTIEFIPILLIENSQQQRQTGAAVESLRNVHAQAAGVMAALASGIDPSQQLEDRRGRSE